MKAEELAVIKERAEKATDGPWYHTEQDVENVERYIRSDTTGRFVVSSGRCHDEDWAEINYTDAEFIANAREDVPKLVAEVERLKENGYQSYTQLQATTEANVSLRIENARLRKALEYYADDIHYDPYFFDDKTCDVTEDEGYIAREALE